jgi:hypothetical protein
MATSAHTTSVTAPGITGGLVTSVSVTRSGDDVLDCSHLGQAEGATANTFASPFTGTTEVSLSYIGDAIPDAGDEGAVSVTGAISVSMSNAICTSASITGAAGELITADVTFAEISS